MKSSFRKWLCVITAVCLFSFSTACAGTGQSGSSAGSGKAAGAAEAAETAESEVESGSSAGSGKAAGESSDQAAEKNGEVYILYTSDVHCGVDQGFGFAGLQQVRDTLEAQGYETILVDDGDAIQGEEIGTLSKGEAIIELMNEMEYDVAIPGNHEFDYGLEQFLELAQMAEFPYISCNFTHEGELVFEPYVIKEAAGLKIAFVGMTTPLTITSVSPKVFENENGELVYGFMEDKTGEKLYEGVQKAVDEAREAGADLVYAMGHMGNVERMAPYTYADVVSHTDGIDVFLDGHSHDTDQVVMKNKDGEEVTRSAVGTKMACIGYSHISAEGEILETGIWNWPNKTAAPDLLNIQNKMRDEVDEAEQELTELTGKVVAHTDVNLTINDPVEKDASGNPIRVIRLAETNLGDFCADAYRSELDADIAFANGGGIRADINKGDITYGDIIKVNPFGNEICAIEATGQQILDALEWSSSFLPGESGGFLQVSGISFEVHVNTETPCKTDDKNMFAGVEGERRVQNVKVGEEAIDPDKTYTVAGPDFILVNQGNGYTMFDGNAVVNGGIIDNQLLIDYILEQPDGRIGSEYEDPYGQGRINIIE